MNLLVKIVKQLRYLPFTLVPLMVNAKLTTKSVVGVENIEYLPYFDGSGDSYHGFSKSLLTLFASQHELELEFYTLPVNRLYKEFIDHQHVDFKYPDNPQWKPIYKAIFSNLRTITYSVPFIVTKTGIASLEKKIPIAQCTSFAIVRGFTPQSYESLMNNKRIELIETANVIELIELLIKQRVKCIYISNDVLNYNTSKYFKLAQPIHFQNQLPIDLQKFSLSSIKHPEVISLFNKFLVSHKTQINKLKQQYQIDH